MADTADLKLDLPGVADMHAFDEMRDTILDRIGSGPVTIRLDQVERISTNTILMLLCAIKSAAEAGSTIKLVAPSPAFADAVAVLGLGQAFAPALEG